MRVTSARKLRDNAIWLRTATRHENTIHIKRFNEQMKRIVPLDVADELRVCLDSAEYKTRRWSEEQRDKLTKCIRMLDVNISTATVLRKLKQIPLDNMLYQGRSSIERAIERLTEVVSLKESKHECKG